MSHQVVRISHPLPDQLPREHAGPHPQFVQCTYFVNAFSLPPLIHTFTQGRYKSGGWAYSDSLHVDLYVHQSQSHSHDSTHPSFFMSWGALWLGSFSHMHQDCPYWDSTAPPPPDVKRYYNAKEGSN